MKRFLLSIALTMTSLCAAERVVHISPSPGLTRADLYVATTVPNPRAILVLCPGMNGNGRSLLTPKWDDFARENQLGLAALSFASREEDLGNGRGYYYPVQGSGQCLVEAIRAAFGHDLPLLLYGMSGGAHFTSRFVEWKPTRVVAWCAYTAGWWDQPTLSKCNPPGIVACGDEDFRYGATLSYFLQGRALGKPWTWVSLAKTGHQSSPALDEFVRSYFAAILRHETATAQWLDVDLKTPISRQEIETHPTLACWLPNRRTAQNWIQLHQP
jgi:hypothetical protein